MKLNLQMALWIAKFKTALGLKKLRKSVLYLISPYKCCFHDVVLTSKGRKVITAKSPADYNVDINSIREQFRGYS